MKASDTVMPKEGIIILSYMNPEIIEGILQHILKEQAERSFNAGIKEVINFLSDNATWDGKEPFEKIIVPKSYFDKWNEQLKEWGIK